MVSGYHHPLYIYKYIVVFWLSSSCCIISWFWLTQRGCRTSKSLKIKHLVRFFLQSCVWNTSHSKKNWKRRYCNKCILVYILSRYSCQIFEYVDQYTFIQLIIIQLIIIEIIKFLSDFLICRPIYIYSVDYYSVDYYSIYYYSIDYYWNYSILVRFFNI